jgi:hypothetical protein
MRPANQRSSIHELSTERTTQVLFEGDQIALHLASYANVGTDICSSQGEIVK